MPTDETEINKRLLFLIRRANRKLSNNGRGVNFPIQYDSPMPPTESNPSSQPVPENKRPDFMWGITDHTEIDISNCDKYFCIEAKRLGLPSSPSWILNKNYIVNGILRFISPDWSYGRMTRSGAMVGYIQSSEFEVIFAEVNTNAESQTIPTLELLDEDEGVTLKYLKHILVRDICISPFSLKHYWIDLRHIYESN
ncbi:MAG: hypothetical protein F6K42_02480 [Leptolyngbya sp. SIO1D8]|nr:hypothetical protein [Leptolyngbya sp. SIO1D8]